MPYFNTEVRSECQTPIHPSTLQILIISHLIMCAAFVSVNNKTSNIRKNILSRIISDFQMSVSEEWKQASKHVAEKCS